MNDRRNDSTYVPEPNTLVLEDQSLRYGFVQLPKQILWAKNLSRDAKMLYAVLLGYAWQESHCYPGYPRLCEDMGASENMVRKYMRELEAIGLLRQKRRGQGRTNLYTLPDIRTAKIAVQEPHQSRPSNTEVQEPHFSVVPEPAKTEGKIETVKEESDQYISNIRKASRQNKLDRQENPNRHAMSASQSTPEETRARIRAKLARARKGTSSNGLNRVGGLIEDLEPDEPVGRLPASRASDEARQALVSYMTDLSRELGDSAPLPSTVTRAYNLMERSGLDLDMFISKIYEARSKTQERTASITTRGEQKDSWGQARKTKMPYFFSVLEDILGLKSSRSIGNQRTVKTG
jgi:DNA-binding transcriptional MerR regulator